jgi:hypothetical protein
MNIQVHIERLILDGLNIMPGQRHLLQAAVETELTRLFAEDGVPSTLALGGAWPVLSTGGIQLTASSEPAQLGQQIAQAVYGGVAQ